MRSQLERQFLHCGRRRQALFADELILLVPREYYGHLSSLDGGKSLIFDIVDAQTLRVAGEIALRTGDCRAMFYLGHIGYHVDPPYRGRNFALRACSLCLPLLAELGHSSFVITTDEDNLPSIRTCEKLGCLLETTVNVPVWCMAEFGISAVKRRYIYERTAF